MTSDQLRRAQERYERDIHGARQARDKTIRDALAAGWTQRKVAEATGLTHGRIAQIAKGTR